MDAAIAAGSALFVLSMVLQHTSILAASLFPDVPDTHVYSDEINAVKQQRIFYGRPDGTFGPDDTINRAEITAVIFRTRGNSLRPCGQPPFPDVELDDWFAKSVCAAKTENVINGYPDGTFRPTDAVSFVEFARIIAGAFDLPREPETDLWYARYIHALQAIGAIPPTIRGVEQEPTRGEVAFVFEKLKDKWDELMRRQREERDLFLSQEAKKPQPPQIHAGPAPQPTGDRSGMSQSSSSASHSSSSSSRNLVPLLVGRSSSSSSSSVTNINAVARRPGPCGGSTIWYGGTSMDGSLIAFVTENDNLVNELNDEGGLFVKNMQTGQLTRIINTPIDSASISPDGLYVRWSGPYRENAPRRAEQCGGWTATCGWTPDSSGNSNPGFLYSVTENTVVSNEWTLDGGTQSIFWEEMSPARFDTNPGLPYEYHLYRTFEGGFVFSSYSALLPADKNNNMDVYKYTTATQSLELVSTGSDGRLGVCSWDNGKATRWHNGRAVDGGAPYRPRCGDGVVQQGEMCDDGARNSDAAPDACRTMCVESYCGDGVCDSDERFRCDCSGGD